MKYAIKTLEDLGYEAIDDDKSYSKRIDYGEYIIIEFYNNFKNYHKRKTKGWSYKYLKLTNDEALACELVRKLRNERL